MRSWIYLCGIRIRFSRAEFAAAEAMVQTLDAWSNEHFVPGWMLDLNAAWQVRLWLVGGNLLEAQQWVTARHLDAAREPAYAQEAAFLALVRVWLAQGRAAEAAVLLAQMAEPAQANGRIARAVEMRILQALAYADESEDDQALSVLENALTLAEPGGFVRVFVDEGTPMARLLYAALEKGTAVSNVRRLLAAFPADVPKPETPANAETYDWVDPLSPREVEVLQHIAEGLTNQEIGVQLSLTLNTIKAHTRNIYSKLAVNSRMQAVARARELGILSST
jgi:LuxR family maltose regulon positive regulatory protein